MANVLLQASILSRLFGGSKPGFFVGGSVEGVHRQLISVSVSSSGVGSGGRGVARSLWVSEEFFQIGLSNEQSRGRKNSSQVRALPQQWRGGIRAGNGESRYYKIAKDTSLKNVSRGDTSEGYFRDQVYDYGGPDDFNPGGPPPERGRGVTGEDEAFPLDEDLEERFGAKGNAEEVRLSDRRREWVQSEDRFGAEGNTDEVRLRDRRREWAQNDARARPETDGRGTNERADDGNFDAVGYAGQRVSTRARREDVVDRPNEGLSREEVLEDDEYIGYARDNTSDRPKEGLSRKEVLEDDEYIGHAKENGIERTSCESANSSQWKNAQERAGDDENRQEIEEDFLFEEDPQGSNFNTYTNEEPWQRSDQTQGQSYGPNPDWDSRSLVEDQEDDFVFRNAQDDDDFYDRGPSNELGAVEEEQRPPPGDFDDRYYFQKSGKYQISDITDDEEQDQILPNRERMERDRISSRKTWRDPEQDMSARGALYAKQVISLSTAQSLGFVTQLWVNLANLKVVALEVRPSLLFGDFNSFLLKSLSKVGDVILIDDDDTVPKERDLCSCSDLVGNDLFTEDGVNLGKVRDYKFSLEDGAVLALEFDNFGVPLIPSSLIRTYSLTVDEVIESEEDSFLLRRGAERRVQKLSKGFFSLSKKSSKERPSAWRRQRNQAPKIQYLGPASERGRIVERDNYSPRYTTPRQQSKRGSGFSSRSENLRSQESDDYQAAPSSRNYLPVKNRPQTSEYEESEDPGLGISMPEMTRNAKGFPMSYRTSRKSVQSNF